jgi:hypothetical protein
MDWRASERKDRRSFLVDASRNRILMREAVDVRVGRGRLTCAAGRGSPTSGGRGHFPTPEAVWLCGTSGDARLLPVLGSELLVEVDAKGSPRV